MIGLLLMPLNTYWIGQTEGVWHALHMTAMSLPMNALYMLIVLVGINHLIKRFAPRIAFSRAELMTVYSMMAVQSVFISHDNLVALMGVMPAPLWYNNIGRHWDNLFFQFIPPGTMVMDSESVHAFYLGGSEFYGSGTELLWWRPMLVWGSILMLLFVMQTCVNVLLSKQWAQKERLAFPLIQLPLAVTHGSAVFQQRLFWTGFGIAAFVDIVNGLSFLYPVVPHFPVKEWELNQILQGFPFDALGWTPVRFYPFVIGFGFLMPLDLSFSCWIFFLFSKVQRIFGAYSGHSQIPRFPYQGEQATGAVFAVCLLALWATRLHFRQVFRDAFGLDGKGAYNGGLARDSTLATEVRQNRIAIILLLVCGFLLYQLVTWMGLPPVITVLFFLLFFVIALTVTRIRAEVGPPAHSMLYVTPQDILVTTLGSANLGGRTLTLFAMLWWFNRLNRNHPMPASLEAFRIAETVGNGRMKTWYLMWVVGALSIVSVTFIYPALFYKDSAVKAAGEVLGVGQDTFDRLDNWMRAPKPPDVAGMTFMVGGFILSMLLGIMRMRFLWWSLHPMGYALGLSYAVDFYWASLIVAWAIKWTLIRYGGVETYRKALPFFFGLILGECIVACSWSILGLLLHKQMYDAWW